MVDSFSKHGEVNNSPVENKSQFDPDKRADVHNQSDSDLKENAGLDPDSRMEVQPESNDAPHTDKTDNLNPDQRAQVEPIKNEINTKDNVENPRNLSDLEKNDLMKNGMSKDLANKCTFKDGIFHVKTINEFLEGKTLETGVSYVKKVIDIGGKKIEGVFPKFESTFTCYLDKENYHESDYNQAKDCMSKLRDAINKNPELKSKFTARQLEQIQDKNCVKISGFVWHHNEELGKMELVDAKIHAVTRHTGGKSIWGGGKENR